MEEENDIQNETNHLDNDFEYHKSIQEPVQKPRKKEARDMAKKIIKELKIKEAPINLREVISHIQKEFNLQIIPNELSKNISGMIVKITEIEEERFAIGFNTNDPWCRRRFTIGHEIGHLLFNTMCNKGSSEHKSIEQECECFAAELLIPKTILKKDFAETPDIPELSKKYLVSAQAMGIKIMDDRLLK